MKSNKNKKVTKYWKILWVLVKYSCMDWTFSNYFKLNIQEVPEEKLDDLGNVLLNNVSIRDGNPTNFRTAFAFGFSLRNRKNKSD